MSVKRRGGSKTRRVWSWKKGLAGFLEVVYNASAEVVSMDIEIFRPTPCVLA
ncbi:MAG: hypothetical protein LBB09_01160 [Rickettsiales bacterium]|jgi:hypothetical protein|nr:hypothetical protein [Rickettsiales bacterium]